jgi:acyl-CoA synthetase (AMP-forming)/AMP-acid ligase II
VEAIIVDKEYVPLLNFFRESHPKVSIIVDDDSDGDSGAFAEMVREGQNLDQHQGGHGWRGLQTEVPDERGLMALSYTSGTTARPKGVEYTHRGAYLAAIGNVIESGLGYHSGRCRYLWTLPQFHACGWTFPWAVTAVRGTHYCLRKIDYPVIWRLLKEEGITHFNAAPTVNTLLCADKQAEYLPQPVRVTVAASPPTAFLFEQMMKLNLQPVHVYGMTETYGPITKGYHMPEWEEIPVGEKYQRMARQGHGFITSLPVRVIKTDLPEGIIDNVAKDGKEIGEIVFLGNICARGYYKNPEATRKLFDGGVLHSGDLAVWHPDGSVQILDRAKDIIISGEYNLFSHYCSS